MLRAAMKLAMAVGEQDIEYIRRSCQQRLLELLQSFAQTGGAITKYSLALLESEEFSRGGIHDVWMSSPSLIERLKSWC